MVPVHPQYLLTTIHDHTACGASHAALSSPRFTITRPHAALTLLCTPRGCVSPMERAGTLAVGTANSEAVPLPVTTTKPRKRFEGLGRLTFAEPAAAAAAAATASPTVRLGSTTVALSVAALPARLTTPQLFIASRS
jgi:hypothetical protein